MFKFSITYFSKPKRREKTKTRKKTLMPPRAKKTNRIKDYIGDKLSMESHL